MDDFLARTGLDRLGFRVAQVERGAEQLDGLTEPGRGLGIHE